MRLKFDLPQLLGYIGITLLVTSVFLQGGEQFFSSSQAVQPVASSSASVATPAPIPVRDPQNQPVHITIPGHIDSAITSEFYRDGIWSISATSASHLKTSAYPGEPNNIIMYGHNRNSIFGPIRWLSGSEEITITLANGSQKSYVITDMQQVTTDQVQFLHPTHGEVLTLYTCAGPFDSERFIVRALPKEVIAATMSAELAATDIETPTASEEGQLLHNSDSVLANPFLDLTGWSNYNWHSIYGQTPNL